MNTVAANSTSPPTGGSGGPGFDVATGTGHMGGSGSAGTELLTPATGTPLMPARAASLAATLPLRLGRGAGCGLDRVHARFLVS